VTDRGTQFYASEGERKEKGISRFEVYLAEKGIKHILCRVSYPQTNGKLERFYGVYDQKKHQFKDIDEYVHWHNKVKPHLSLNLENLETPIQAFHRKNSKADAHSNRNGGSEIIMGNYNLLKLPKCL